MERTIATWSVAAVLACASPTRADEASSPPPSVKQQRDALAREGTNHFRLNEFDAALRSYTDAYRVSPSAELLYDIGQCYRKLNRKQDAIDSFKNFIEETTDPAQKAEVEGIIQRLEAALQQESAARNAPPQGPLVPAPAAPLLRVTSLPAVAELCIDDSPQLLSTPAEVTTMTPGKHRLRVSKRGFSAVEQEVELQAGETTQVALTLPPAPATVAAAPRPEVALVAAPQERQPVYKKWWLWTTVGLVVVAGAGVTLGLTLGASAPHGSLGPAIPVR